MDPCCRVSRLAACPTALPQPLPLPPLPPPPLLPLLPPRRHASRRHLLQSRIPRHVAWTAGCHTHSEPCLGPQTGGGRRRRLCYRYQQAAHTTPSSLLYAHLRRRQPARCTRVAPRLPLAPRSPPRYGRRAASAYRYARYRYCRHCLSHKCRWRSLGRRAPQPWCTWLPRRPDPPTTHPA